MSEIRDRVISQASDLIQLNYERKASWEIAKLILEIPELAVVDREAELPKGVFDYEQHKRILREAGWVKEIK